MSKIGSDTTWAKSHGRSTRDAIWSAGCIAGLHEVLRRQGLLEGTWCLDPHESLSRGQIDEIDRIYRVYPHLNDDDFVREHRDEWLKP